MVSKRNNRKLLYSLLALLLLIIAVISGRGFSSAYADSTSYSDVLSDLEKDESFDASDYPLVYGDYKPQVIQIAESNKYELLLYVYHPCGQTEMFVATSVNMSLSESVDGTKPYKLTLLNSSGTLYKYRVDGVKVGSEAVRYYNISTIYRKWVKNVDDPTGNDNTVNEVAFAVGKLFKAETVDGAVKYSCEIVDVVEILNPYVDFLSYGQWDGWDLIFGVMHWTDIHYLAFSTDKKIDTLQKVDITYTTQPYFYTQKNDKGYTYGEESDPQVLSLTGEEKVGVDGFEKYTWNSIYRTQDFIETADLKGSAKTEVEKSEFVLVFLKTPFEEQSQWSMMQGHYKEAEGMKVSNVSILRLKFVTDGITYDLGAVMDKQEGDDIAGNKPDLDLKNIGFWEYVWRCIVRLFNGTASFTEIIVAVIALLFALILLPLVIKLLELIVPIIGKLIILLFKAVWWIICLPFKGIMALFSKKDKNKRKGKKEKDDEE